jgi:acyl-CoA-dependent ceramide synthase
MLFVISLHIFLPQARIHTRKFLQLSYPSRTDQTYTQGIDDIYFLVAWVVNFTALRAISIEWILQPLAGYWDVAKKSHLRFAEQGWLVLYYVVFWGLGMVRDLVPHILCSSCTGTAGVNTDAENHSTSGITPFTGLTMPKSGPPGLRER